MSTNPCQLTDEWLPLYVDGQLSPDQRQMLAKHAAACPACAERLEAALANLTLPARRTLPSRARVYGLFTLFGVALLLMPVLLMLRPATKPELELLEVAREEAIPARVDSADELAHMAVYGWRRAEEQGLVKHLGITQSIPGTEATVTWEKVWFGEQETYLLYTVKAPEGKYIMPTWAFLGDLDQNPSGGQTEWNRLQRWGGFSLAGFHSVLVFKPFRTLPTGTQLGLEVRQWASVSPRNGLDPSSNPGSTLKGNLPWEVEWASVPDPAFHPVQQVSYWLGRTLQVDSLRVGVGMAQLTGWVDLPAGERDPQLVAALRFGGHERKMTNYQVEPLSLPGRYSYIATFEPPDIWPTPVELELDSIIFRTDRTLEWTFPWAPYRDADRPVDLTPDEQQTIPFYDSTLRTYMVWSEGVGLYQITPTDLKPPYVRKTNVVGGGTGIDREHPGMEVVGPGGEALTNFGGGGGPTDFRDGKEFTQVSARWDPSMLPESFRQANTLTLRYVHPAAAMILEETWSLVK